MNIGVNARHLVEDKLEGLGWYSYEIIKRLVDLRPKDNFILFYDRKTNPLIFGENVTNVVLPPPTRHHKLFKLWFDFILPYNFKKFNIDIFFSPDGFVSTRTSIRQIGVIHDLNFEHYPNDLPKGVLNYYRKNMPVFARTASELVTVSNFSKKDIMEKYSISSKKIEVIYNGGSSFFKPLTIEERQDFKNNNKIQKPYFIYVGSLHKRKNIERMLKAFKIFNEENNFNLMIVGELMWKNQLNLEGLVQNVVFLGRKSKKELSSWVASSNGLIYVSYFEGFGLPVLEGMMSGIPVVTSNVTSIPEVGGNAVIYTDPFSVDSIKEGMKKAVKKGNFINFRKKGLEQSKIFSWDKSATKVAKLLFK